MATVPSQRTWTAFDVVTAAMMNANVRDAVNWTFTSRPLAQMRQTVAQSLTNGSYSAITFDAEDLDRDAGHSTVTNTDRYTVQTSGWYLCGGAVGFASNATGIRVARWTLNGTQVNGSTSSLLSSGAATFCLPTRGVLINTAVNDIIRLEGRQDSGGALNTAVTTDQQSSASIMWVGS